MTDQVDLAKCMVCNDKLPTTALLPCGPFAKQRGESEAGRRGGTVQVRGIERLERAREQIWRCCEYLAISVLTIVCAYALHVPTHGGQLPSTTFFTGHKCVCQECAPNTQVRMQCSNPCCCQRALCAFRMGGWIDSGVCMASQKCPIPTCNEPVPCLPSLCAQTLCTSSVSYASSNSRPPWLLKAYFWPPPRKPVETSELPGRMQVESTIFLNPDDFSTSNPQ